MAHGRKRMLAARLVFVIAWLTSVAAAQTTTTPTENAGYRVAGIAVNAISGKPLARAEVSIESQEGKKVHEAYATGTDGRFSFEGLAAGRYVLLGGRRGYVTQAYKGHVGFSTAIVAGPGLKTDDLRFAISPGASISGQVVDERGDVSRNARVILLREASTGKGWKLARAGSKYTDDLGRYRFGHLSGGVYVLAVLARTWHAEVASTGAASSETPSRG